MSPSSLLSPWKFGIVPLAGGAAKVALLTMGMELLGHSPTLWPLCIDLDIIIS